MSKCCTPAEKTNDKQHTCPANGRQYHQAPYSTVLHHIKQPWLNAPKEQKYYFCDDPECDIVYFGIDNSTIRKSMLRHKVGIKETSMDTLICYCFDVTKADAETHKDAKKFVIEQTKNTKCACETRNPSGRCCLKDFPK